VAIQHSTAADAVVNVDEPLSQDAATMYQKIADADATITASYLANPEPQLIPLQRYQTDIKVAITSLAALQAAAGSHADPAVRAALNEIGPGLNVYGGDIAEAKTEYAMGFPLTGGSFLQVASEEAHVVLLPAAHTVYLKENAAVSAASSQATELPTLIAAIAVAVIVAIVLYRVQRWLTKRTNRMLSIGLGLASVLLVVSTLWLAVGFLSARADLNRGIDHGSVPAENLALASIDVQQIRGDAVLNVISRSGNASFQDDFESVSKIVGPGANGGSLLDDAAAAQLPGSAGATDLAAAKTDATAWYAANTAVYTLGNASKYELERQSVIGTGPGSSAAGYATLEQNIQEANKSDQQVFTSAATSGAHTLDPLAGVVIAAAILMALASAWGITRRLAEYR